MFMSSEYTKRGREERKREMEKRLEINEKKRLTQVMRSLSLSLECRDIVSGC
jgi:hypothetical protein